MKSIPVITLISDFNTDWDKNHLTKRKKFICCARLQIWCLHVPSFWKMSNFVKTTRLRIQILDFIKNCFFPFQMFLILSRKIINIKCNQKLIFYEALILIATNFISSPGEIISINLLSLKNFSLWKVTKKIIFKILSAYLEGILLP